MSWFRSNSGTQDEGGFFSCWNFVLSAVVISDLIWRAQRVENNDTIIAAIERGLQFEVSTWITTFDWYFNLFFWQMKDNENQLVVGSTYTGEYLIFFIPLYPLFQVYAEFPCFKCLYPLSAIYRLLMELTCKSHFTLQHPVNIFQSNFFLTTVPGGSIGFQTRCKLNWNDGMGKLIPMYGCVHIGSIVCAAS